ncbi:hypothetical protein SLA2020_060750 [Shorea laevis]
MAEQHSNESSSTNNISWGSSNSSVELKIKTLDSQIFSFQAEKNMLVSLFKEKIAEKMGIPVGQQRLIFRGKVLKDDHPLSEYHVENGDTLHLVERQLAQPQASSSAGTGEANGNSNNRGSDGSAGSGRNRVGQISHSVVLGTLNFGDQGEGVVPDMSQVIGAFLNSIGVGGQPTINVSNSTQSSTSAPQRNETDGSHSSMGNQSQTGNQTQSAQSPPGHTSQFSPQVVQIPLTGAAVPLPSFHSPIPDSLRTLSDFVTHMEEALSQNGYQPNASSANTRNIPRVDLPSDMRGLATLEALSIVLRHVGQLLGNHAINALSHIAGRLEQERDSSDPTVREQIQRESAQVGHAMQHLGALLLELGRTMLTLRMGQSPVQSSINAGPAVYISSSGPNPIMVQPFPLQTSSMFSGSNLPPNPTTLGPVGIGSAPRHINIHIHAGTSLAPVIPGVDSRASTGEGTQGERSSNTGSGSMRVLPVRNVVAATIPAARPGPSGFALSAQPAFYIPTSQPPSDSSLPNVLTEVNSRMRNFVGNVQGENQVASGNNSGNEPPNNVAVGGAAYPTVTLPVATAEREGQQPQPQSAEASKNDMTAAVVSSKEDASSCVVGATSCSSGEPTVKSDDATGSGSGSSGNSTKPVPLGLGLRGLEHKRRFRQPQSPVQSADSETTSTPPDQQLNTRTVGQHLLQSFASRNSATNRIQANEAPSINPVVGNSRSSGGQGSDDPLDTANAVSQVLQSPALNGLLAGFSEQTGVGSPDVLRNMLQQLTQSPQIMNTVSQIAQQVDSQDLGNMFSGLGGGQSGGIDLSQMVQQMMPVVSQALSRGSNAPQPFPVVEPQSQTDHGGRRSRETNKPSDQDFQINMQQVAQMVEQCDSPGDIFHAVVENAVQLHGGGRNPEDLLDELCCDEDLANEYAQMLQRDIHRHLEGNSSKNADSS